MPRVLVVDDEPSIARTLRINLAARVYVVILDLGLPDLDGVEVLRRLREEHDVPVVVLSARQESDDLVEALDAGVDDYVTKPFGIAGLMARVRAAVRRGEGLRARHRWSSRRPTSSSTSTVTRRPGRVRRCGSSPPSGGCWRFSPAPTAGWSRRSTCSSMPGGRAAAGSRTTSASTRSSCAASSSPTRRTPRHLITEPGLGYRLVV